MTVSPLTMPMVCLSMDSLTDTAVRMRREERTVTKLSEPEVRAFVEKLEAFSRGLSEGEKELLRDVLTRAAGAQSDDVQGYTAVEFPLFIAWIPVLIDHLS